MNRQEKIMIEEFRKKGYSIYSLAKALNISYSTVKSHCQRKNIVPLEELRVLPKTQAIIRCEECGKLFVGRTYQDTFVCSAKCRMYRTNRLMKYKIEQERLSNIDFSDEEAPPMPPMRTDGQDIQVVYKRCTEETACEEEKDWTYTAKRGINIYAWKEKEAK